MRKSLLLCLNSTDLLLGLISTSVLWDGKYRIKLTKVDKMIAIVRPIHPSIRLDGTGLGDIFLYNYFAVLRCSKRLPSAGIHLKVYHSHDNFQL